MKGDSQGDVNATPAQVVTHLTDELAQLEGKFPEFADFGERQWDPERPLEIRFRHGVAKSVEMRGVLPSDIQPKGAALDFALLPKNRPVHMTLKRPRACIHLDHLEMMLLSEFVLSDEATEGLDERLETILEKHRTWLEDIDKAAANK